MRVLVVHNRYRSGAPSGENRIVDDEVSMLREAGVDVTTFFRDSDEIDHLTPAQKASLAISPIYNRESVQAFKRLLAERPPDIVHVHNPFPLVSPWVLRVATRAAVPLVQTVHNYRLACPAGTLFRDGEICEDCVGRPFPWPSVLHGCYRQSRPQSLVMAASSRVHKRTWGMVNRFLPVSHFVGGMLSAFGIPSDRITVKFNGVPDPGPAPTIGRGFLFAGRLTREKGVELLLQAWRASGLGTRGELRIAGAGPLQGLVEEEASKSDSGVTYLGVQNREECSRLMHQAGAIVSPSIWYEGLPTSILEAFAHGRPVVGVKGGATQELVGAGRGWLTDPSPSSLADGLLAAHASIETRTEFPDCRKSYLETFSVEASTRRLLDTYGDVAWPSPLVEGKHG